MPVTIALALSVLSLTQAQTANTPKHADRSATWRCAAEQKWGCELPGGCERQDATKVWMVVDFAKRTYQRCDRNGCDSYAMTPTEKGVFTYIRLRDHPDVFMKMGLADLFVEVVSQGVSTLNSFGTCAPVPR